jgi:hypothetical protein
LHAAAHFSIAKAGLIGVHEQAPDDWSRIEKILQSSSDTSLLTVMESCTEMDKVLVQRQSLKP